MVRIKIVLFIESQSELKGEFIREEVNVAFQTYKGNFRIFKDYIICKNYWKNKLLLSQIEISSSICKL